jgi:hypothetical protein
LDYHTAHFIRVLLANGQWVAPKILGILDDRSRLCCHAQWYLDESAANLIHALIQAIQKDLNGQLADWIERIAHARTVPGDPSRRPVRDALADERERLLHLPDHRFECDHARPVISGKQPYVRFDRNDYSIPHDRIRQPLTLIASESEIRITDAVGNELARHRRSHDSGVVVEDPAHLEKLTAEKRRALELRRRDRLRGACLSAAAFLDALARRGEPIGTHAARLARLLDAHGPGAVESALAEALDRGAISAASVAHLLDQRARARKAPPPIPVVLPDDPACATSGHAARPHPVRRALPGDRR